MDILQIYQDYGIDHKTEGHKHCRPGWVNVECPFCSGNEGYHLGYEFATKRFVCWRCGWHSPEEVLMTILNISKAEVKKILPQYNHYLNHIPKVKINPKKYSFKLPPHTELQKNHIKYLEERGFDVDMLISKFHLLGTGPISFLKTENKILDYKHRILIPYIWDDRIISFDSRDITGKASNKYMACPDERELLHRKEILFGLPETFKRDVGIAVEGPTDVFRFHKYGFALSGIKFKYEQVLLIKNLFKRVFVLFDGPSETSKEKESDKKANELVSSLRMFGVEAVKIKIKGDPGGVSQAEADYLTKTLIN